MNITSSFGMTMILAAATLGSVTPLPALAAKTLNVSVSTKPNLWLYEPGKSFSSLQFQVYYVNTSSGPDTAITAVGFQYYTFGGATIDSLSGNSGFRQVSAPTDVTANFTFRPLTTTGPLTFDSTNPPASVAGLTLSLYDVTTKQAVASVIPGSLDVSSLSSKNSYRLTAIVPNFSAPNLNIVSTPGLPAAGATALVSPSAVPEPGAWIMLCVGAALTGATLRLGRAAPVLVSRPNG